MKPEELAAVRAELLAFAGEMFTPLARADQRRWGEIYLRGLMVDGRRKSIEPMAARLPDGDEQCLQQFVNQSPWEVEPVRQRLARRMVAELAPLACDRRRHRLSQGGTLLGRGRPPVLRHPGQGGQLPDRGLASRRPPRQASCPLDWRLFLPQAWDDDRRAARQGAPAGRRSATAPKWRLALEMLDELRGWGVAMPPVVADAGYGEISAFRAALDERGLAYVVEVNGTTSAYDLAVRRRAAPLAWQRPPPGPPLPPAPSSLRALALAAGPGARPQGRLARGLARHDALALSLPALPSGQHRPAARPPRGAAGGLAALPSGRPARPSRSSTGSPTCPTQSGARRARAPGQAALAHRARLPRAQGRPRPRPLRGALLPWLAPPRHPGQRWRTASSPCSAWTQKRMRRSEPVCRPARAAAAAGLLDRRLPDLRTQATRRDRLSSCAAMSYLTEHY